jgi:hypothetical protein
MFLFYTQVVLIILLCVVIVNQHTCMLCRLRDVFTTNKSKQTRASNGQKQCQAHTCGALDDVNNPAYNVRETIKQTLLLEQHLAEKAKYCKSCCVKHFLLIESYLVEGIWMAGNHCKDYPKLEESVDFFKKLFDKWHKNMDDEQTRLVSLTQLREWRREMVDLYYFNGKQPDVQS